MKFLAKIIINFQLIPDDISERGLISIEVLHIATLLAVVKTEIGLLPP